MNQPQHPLGSAQHPASESRSNQQTIARSTFRAWIAGVSGTLVAVAIVASLLSYFFGTIHGRAELGNIIALKHVPHTTAPSLNNLYTAIVWVEPEKNGYGVFARITIGGSFGTVEYIEDVGRLGTAASHEDAVERFGEVSWDNTTVYFGPKPGVGRRVNREQLQRHR